MAHGEHLQPAIATRPRKQDILAQVPNGEQAFVERGERLAELWRERLRLALAVGRRDYVEPGRALHAFHH